MWFTHNETKEVLEELTLNNYQPNEIENITTQEQPHPLIPHQKLTTVATTTLILHQVYHKYDGYHLPHSPPKVSLPQVILCTEPQAPLSVPPAITKIGMLQQFCP